MRSAQDLDVLAAGTSLPSKVLPSRELSTTAPRRQRALWLALSVAVFIVVVDQATKAWADRRLLAGSCNAAPDACIDLFWTARLHLHYNPGAAFSTGRGLGPLFGVIAFVMAGILLNVARTRTDRLGPALLGAISGGAIGNLIDRVVRAEDGFLSGEVIDFIDFQWWPIFNVADSGVVVGVVAFVIYSFIAPDDDAGELSAASGG